ncbi:hypothetical protein GCM10027020_02070 [Nocardioides salsibiostraticola]
MTQRAHGTPREPGEPGHVEPDPPTASAVRRLAAGPRDRDDPRVTLDAEVIAGSGLFDNEFYAAQRPALRETDEDLLRHFCRTGWRELLRPSADFDVWWYWSNYLDPSQDETNPLAHYILEGRAAGHTGMPATTQAGPGHPLPADRPVRRVCLLAGHDVDGVVDDYVVAYARELSRHSDVYYLCDGYLDPDELAKLDECTTGAWAIRHGAYDFGSYSLLAQELVGWDVLDEYDEVLLVNDSCYLLRPLDDVFEDMNARACDWWGLQATKGLALTAAEPSNSFAEPIALTRLREELLEEFERDVVYDFHVGSYFLAFRRPVVQDDGFRRLLSSVHRQRGKLAIIQKYEIGLTRYLIGNRFAFDTFCSDLYPFHPLFTEWYFRLVETGFPLLKRYLIYQNHYDVPGLREWKERITSLVPDAPVEMFERNLLRVAPHDRLARSFAIERDETGAVTVPRLLAGRDFRRRDAATPTFEHWWAFPVSADLHTLPDNSRAIFEEVRDDPSVKKIVLTRSRDVTLTGENVVVLPLNSPEGQEHLLRSGQVFVKDRPRASLGQPLSSDHNVIVVRPGLALESPAQSSASASVRPIAPAGPRRTRAALGSSRVDQLAAGSLHYPLAYDDLWMTGHPALDFLLAARDRLPDDLAGEEDRLQDELDGRRLLLFAPSRRAPDDRPAYPFSHSETSWLAEWCTRHDVVLGLREHPHDQTRDYSRSLREVSLDLSARRYPHVHVVLRSVDALLTDYHSLALDFLATGRPIVNFAPDLDDVAGSLLYDLEHVLPGPVVRSFDQLSDALDTVFDEPDDQARRRRDRSRQLFHQWVDDQSSHRVVRMVKSLYVEGINA